MKWDSSDSVRFRDYIHKTDGKLMLFLRQMVPVTTGKTIEEVALEAKYKEGCEFILRKLDEILTDENKSDDASSASFITM